MAEATTGSGLTVGAVANSGIFVPGLGVGAGEGVKLLSSMKKFSRFSCYITYAYFNRRRHFLQRVCALFINFCGIIIKNTGEVWAKIFISLDTGRPTGM